MNTELLKSRDKQWRGSKLKVKSLHVCGCVSLCVFSSNGQTSLYFLSSETCFGKDCPSRTSDKLFRWDFWIGCWKCDPNRLPDFLCNLESLISVPCFLISNFIQMWLGVRVERWESHTEVKRAKGETQGITFFKSSNVDCLNISSSLHGPHIFAGRIHYKKQEREKIL